MNLAVLALGVVTVAAAGCGGQGQTPVAASTPAEALAAPSAAPSEGITVTGQGSVKVTPNAAEWSLGVQTTEPSATAALEANASVLQRVVAAVRAKGVAKDDLQTEHVSVWPQFGDAGTSVDGYTATNSVRVTVRDIVQTGEILDAAVAAGANNVYGPKLAASERRAQYENAVAKAYDDARARAVAVAEKAGLELGRPLAIIEGGGDELRYAEVEAAQGGGETPIEPGLEEVSAALTVTFAISG